MPIYSRSGITPHRVRVCSMLHRLQSARSVSELGPKITGLIHLTYEMERGRCPGDVEFDLTFADLLAQAVENQGDIYNEDWVRVLAKVSGEVPVGAKVRLEDGSVGIVLGPSKIKDPLRPSVLVNDQILIPSKPVELISSAALHAG